MTQTPPLISASQLAACNHDARVLVLDCRHDLANRQMGIEAWRAGHIPGAGFFDMETDGAGDHNGKNGRHPLPTREQARDMFFRLGLRDAMRLVVYDSTGGMFAARAWWMAKWIGFEAVQLLDGGIGAWERLVNNATNNTSPRLLGPALAPRAPASGHLILQPSLVGWVNAVQLGYLLGAKTTALIDARAPARYRGETEPLDPVAGHIPSAINRFYQDNLTAEGLFKTKEQLRSEWSAILGKAQNNVVHQCGSGVTACHNIIAQQVAGLGNGLLYPGSWSEWCLQPSRPVATGASPGIFASV
jgi:thiosulfate/3-mercaptopyruvate sulfurtransferase